MRSHMSSWTMSGQGYLREIRLLGIWWFHEDRVQKWSPSMREIESEIGFRIGNNRLSFTWTTKHFKKAITVP